MKYTILNKSNEEYLDTQTNNGLIPIVVFNNQVANNNIYLMSDPYVIWYLGLEDVQGEQTEETNYINQLNDLLSIYSNAE